jgi:hypothetical protein
LQSDTGLKRNYIDFVTLPIFLNLKISESFTGLDGISNLKS